MAHSLDLGDTVSLEKQPDTSTSLTQNSFLPRMGLNDNKAGMKGLDKEKINRIIMENTVGSKYYKNEQKRDAQVQDRILKMKSQLAQCDSLKRAAALQKADAIIREVEKERLLDRTIIHIDMDAFYAAVEERDQPHLKTKPMAVGGMDMLSTSNYVARKYGVRAAMPGFIALKLCPELVIVPLNFTKYKEVSKVIQSIYADYDENYMAASLDEAYLDVTDHLQSRILLTEAQRTHKYHPDLATSLNTDENLEETSKTFGFSAEEVAREIRFRIQQKTLLTASAGIAPNLMLAKIGSDLNKPNGQALIPFEKESILNFMKDLPLRKVSGIGKVSEQLLRAFDIQTCGEIITKRDVIVLLFSPTSSSFFLRAGLGCSSNRIFQDGERKSISTERTFNTISSQQELMLKLEELSHALSQDVKKCGVEGKTITLKTKTVNFELHTRSKTSQRSISTFEEIFDAAKELLKQEIQQAGSMLSLRLMGVGLSKLESPTGNKQSSIKRFFSKSESIASKPEDLQTDVESFSDKPQTSNSVNEETEKATEVNDDSLLDSCYNEDDSMSSRKNTEDRNDSNSDNLICPVCSKHFAELSALNSHLDECLTTGRENSSNIDEISHCVDLTCPICLVVFDGSKTDLQFFNSHIDTCLNRQAIKGMLKSDTKCDGSGKKSTSKSPTKPAKKRKLNPKQLNTIDKFFT